MARMARVTVGLCRKVKYAACSRAFIFLVIMITKKMSEAFVADCVTRVDALCARWFPEAIKQDVRIVPPSTIELVRPRECNVIYVTSIAIAAAILAVITVLIIRS